VHYFYLNAVLLDSFNLCWKKKDKTLPYSFISLSAVGNKVPEKYTLLAALLCCMLCAMGYEVHCQLVNVSISSSLYVYGREWRERESIELLFCSPLERFGVSWYSRTLTSDQTEYQIKLKLVSL
jgi:hypothetical protein